MSRDSGMPFVMIPVVLALSGVVARAQDPEFKQSIKSPGTASDTLAVQYLVSLPTARTSDFIGDISFRGVGLEWVNFGKRSFGLGLSFRWIYFYDETEDQTFTSGNVTVTGNQYRSFDVLPLLVEARLRIPAEGSIAPYVGLGAGGIYAQKRHQVGIYEFEEQTGWQFGFAAEVGLECCSFGGDGNLGFSLRYDAGLGSDAVSAISFFSLKLGVVFNL